MDTKLIHVELDDMLLHDFEQFLDLITERAFGTFAVSEIDYEVLGIVNTHTLLMRVSGNLMEGV